MIHTTASDLCSAHVANFQRFALRSSADECWEWTGDHYKDGYARSTAQTTTSGHRIAYLLLRGDVPAPLVLDHLCRNRGCVNPWHLEPVTNLENIRRQRWSGVCRKGIHEMTDDNSYWSPDGLHRRCRACVQMSKAGKPRKPRVQARRPAPTEAPPLKRAECSKGHSFTEQNTRWRTSSGGHVYRTCRECERITKQKAREKAA
jgi:hypothetical protein